MKRIKKLLLAAIAAAIAATSFAGCAGGTNTTSGDDNDSRSNNDVSASESFNVTASDSETLSPADSGSVITDNSTSSDVTSDVSSETENSSESETAAPDATDAPADAFTSLPIGLITSETESAPVSESDYAPIPTNAEMLKLVGTNFDNTDSFIMTCKIKGKAWLPGYGEAPLMEHNYTYVITKDATYLKSTYQDLNNDTVPSVYEEYRVVEDNILSTITKNGDEWVNNASLEMQRDNMVDDTINSMALLRFFNNEYTYNDGSNKFLPLDTIGTAPITRDENGNMAITFPKWKECQTTDEVLDMHPVAGLIRFPEKTGDLHTISTNSCNGGNVVYTVDNNYRLKTIEADIVSGSKYDLHVEIEFSDYNNVLPLNIPAYTTVQPITAE